MMCPALWDELEQILPLLYMTAFQVFEKFYHILLKSFEIRPDTIRCPLLSSFTEECMQLRMGTDISLDECRDEVTFYLSFHLRPFFNDAH